MGTILLIDDNEDILDSTAELLELANYKVYKANRGRLGMELAQKHNPDLVLCDVMMPDIDGYGVLRGIRNVAQLKGTSFVFISAKTEINDLRYGMELGADDYLFKPYSGDKLLSTVATRVEKGREMKQAFRQSGTILLSGASDETPLDGIPGVLEKFAFKTIRKKDVLFREGEESNNVFYVSKGRIKTYRTNEDGKDYITNIFTPGDFFGFSSLSGNSCHTESAEAIEETEIGYVSKQIFLQILESNPSMSTKFIKILSGSLCESKNNLVKMAYNSARKRVSEALIYIARKHNDNLELKFPMSRNDISSISGISPESVSRNLSDFKEEKLIEIENGYVRILNPQKLLAMKN